MKTVVAIMALIVLGVVAVTVFGGTKNIESKDTELESVVPFSEAEFNAAHAGDIRVCPACEKRWQGLHCLDGYNPGECVGCGILRDSAQMLFNASNTAAAEELKRNNAPEAAEAKKQKLIEGFKKQNPHLKDADIQVTFDADGVPHIVAGEAKK